MAKTQRIPLAMLHSTDSVPCVRRRCADARKRMRVASFFIAVATGVLSFISCSADQEHMAAAINESDSLAFMTATGVSTLISDSGVIRYKLVAEDWQIHNTTVPATWKFLHGFFMERFDQNMHADLYVQADTAYLHKQSVWELRGRVVVKNLEGTLFLTQELFWNMDEHRMWNHMPMDIYMPDRELHGTEFRSNEQMTDYFVQNSYGAFPASDTESDVPTPPEMPDSVR
ncbi:MAG: LPS export ABC transporter periplasmic protein LptC [Bacteroidales bacterium]|nr:LPS export ABC transporter periplasmic protein LptC [Candidatus Physcousia equi]